MSNKTLICFFCIILSVACREQQELPIDLGRDYFPLELGNYWEYSVTERIYFGENDREEAKFFFRDEIKSRHFNGAGEEVFVVIRQKSPNRQDWENELAFIYRVTGNTVLRTSENRTTVPFVFPPAVYKRWDGNLYNELPEDDYHISEVGSYSFSGREFDDTIKVQHSKEDDFIILRDIRFEVFARGIGMVESYMEVLTYCSRNDCLGEQIIDSGRFVHLKLVDNG